MKLTRSALINLANYLDKNGLTRESDQVDSLMRKYATEFDVGDPVNVVWTDGYTYPGMVKEVHDGVGWLNSYKIQWGGRFKSWKPSWADEDMLSLRGDSGSSSMMQDALDTVYTTPSRMYRERGVSRTMEDFAGESSEALQEQWNEIYNSIDSRDLETLSLVWKLASSAAMFIPGAQPAAIVSLKLSAAADVAAFVLNLDRAEYVNAVFNAISAIITVTIGSPLNGTALKGLFNWIIKLKRSGSFAILRKSAPLWFVSAINSLLKSMTDILGQIAGDGGASLVSGFLAADDKAELESGDSYAGFRSAALDMKSEVASIQSQIDVSDAVGRGASTPPSAA